MSDYGFAEGMIIGVARRAAGEDENGTMVFDWNKAAQLIRDRKPKVAEAGLAGDWTYTGGCIYREGAPVSREDTYTYLASFWAKPQLDLDGEHINCFRMRDEEADPADWDSGTFWPESALAILNA